MSDYAPQSMGLLAPIKTWYDDAQVSEILINEPQCIYVEKHGQLTKQDVPEYTQLFLDRLFQLIANENNQQLTAKKPLLSGSLLDGSRVQLVIPPTAKHYTLSIRRQVVRHLSLDDYASHAFYQQATGFNVHDVMADDIHQLPPSEQVLLSHYHAGEWDAFIRCAIALKKNIVISGGTSSGKTTYLNACLRQIPDHERIITLEDTREIDTPHPNQVNLLASKGDQGLSAVTIQDLVQCCLRLRPDRIIVGEIRGREILDFLSACSTGHEGSLTSIHANNPRIAFMRMTQMYKLNNVPSMTDQDIMRELTEVVDVIVQLVKTSNASNGKNETKENKKNTKNRTSERQVQGIYYKYGHISLTKK